MGTVILIVIAFAVGFLNGAVCREKK